MCDRSDYRLTLNYTGDSAMRYIIGRRYDRKNKDHKQKALILESLLIRIDSSISKGVQRRTIEGMIIYISDWDP